MSDFDKQLEEELKKLRKKNGNSTNQKKTGGVNQRSDDFDSQLEEELTRLEQKNKKADKANKEAQEKRKKEYDNQQQRKKEEKKKAEEEARKALDEDIAPVVGTTATDKYAGGKRYVSSYVTGSSLPQAPYSSPYAPGQSLVTPAQSSGAATEEARRIGGAIKAFNDAIEDSATAEKEANENAVVSNTDKYAGGKRHTSSYVTGSSLPQAPYTSPYAPGQSLATPASQSAAISDKRLQAVLADPNYQEVVAANEEANSLDFFQKGAFEDGFDWSDIPASILGTVGDAAFNAVKGVAGFAEGISDLAWYGVAGVLDINDKLNVKYPGLENLDLADAADDIREAASENQVEQYTAGAQNWLDQYSVLGRTSKSILQGVGQAAAIASTAGVAGAAGMGTAGTTAVTTGTTFASSMGSGMSEAYQGGATDLEALEYGLMSGAADATTELIFAGMGKSINAVGYSKGLSSADDMLAKAATKGIKNQVAKNIVQFGIKSGAEGLEEVLAGIAQAYAKKATYMSDEEFLEILADENLLEQFIVGTATSGVMQGGDLVNANKTGTDFITGHTQNEQAVIKKEVENRIAEAEKDGTELTKKEKSEIEAQVEKDMEKGYISTDTIESVLGNDPEYDSLVQESEEFKELYETTDNLSEKQRDRLAELKEKNKANPYETALETAKKKRSESVFDLVKNDRLIESYNERSRRGQAFEADLTKYDAKQRAVVEKAVNSGILNNTNRTHEFVDMIAKISADNGVLFDFTNNQKLKESGFAVDGKTVNGFVTKDGITLNMDSSKAWQSTVGHEITHVLEGTDLYTELQKAVSEYAKTKGEYQSRYDTLAKMYESIEGADIDAELTADLVGDYLFTDPDFINNLSTKHRNVFQKIYDEVKYLLKVATAGSKEARELEKVKRAFDKAYRESTQVKSDNKADTQYSLVTDEDTIDFLDKQEQVKVYRAMQVIDGELYPPMAARVKDDSGKKQLVEPTKPNEWYQADERPELMKFEVKQQGKKKRFLTAAEMEQNASVLYGNPSADDVIKLKDGSTVKFSELGLKFELDKANGSTVPAAYNPYFHTSLAALNDQFSSAYNRPNLVVVEGYIPKSELTSGYKALYAKDSVGETTWHSGPVASALKGEKARKVFLSRWFKVGRIVSDTEAAGEIAKTLKGENLSIPWNVVTPSLRKALEAKGVEIDYRDAKLGSTVVPFDSTKYSLSDSDGNKLTKEQADYFKDSKMRDADGNLKVMYHGSQNGGFHTFDPNYSDDDTSLFFVDSNDVASSYSGTSETYAARTFKTAEDFNKFFAEIGATDYEVKEADGKLHLYEDGDLSASSESGEEIYEEFRDLSGLGYGNVNYKAYLNLKNPLVVDAEGRDWNALPSVNDDSQQYEYIKLVEVGDDNKVTIEYSMVGDPSPTTERVDLYQKFDYGLADTLSNMSPGESLEDAYANPSTTRDYAKYAKENGYDGVIFKNIYDIGGYGSNGATEATVAIAFDSNQIKSVANTKPTGDPDIRYSLGEDSQGRELSPAVKNRFANSKVVDENGNLKVVYHGTPNGEFTVFDKTKGSVEGDFGSGFYFTDDDYDVEVNYEGGGPDFDNKVARLAEQIEQEEDIDYEEAEERARNQLYKGSHLFEVYLNIENPAVVGETMLFDGESYLEQYNEEDYEDYDEYIADVEQLLADDVDNIIWEIERNVDVDSTDGLADILYNAYYEGGIGIEDLKKKINELYLTDSEGNLVGNEVARQIIESLGYDGIIDPTVSTKFNMELEESTTHYIVFKPNQIKAVTNENPTDNPDIHRSLSNEGEQPKRYGNYSTPARDLRLETAEEVAPEVETTTEEELFPDNLVPAEQELENLLAEQDDIRGAMEAMFAVGDHSGAEQLLSEYDAVTAKIAEIQQSETERLDSLTEEDAPPEMEAPYQGEPDTVKNPFEDRDWYSVGNRKVKAYMYENPEVKPFFREEALALMSEWRDTTRGERFYNDQAYLNGGNEDAWTGVSRHTSKSMEILLDSWHMSYDDIEKGLNAIIEDNGAENIAAAKKIEFMLNDRLLNGYTDFYTNSKVPPNQDYINLLNEMQINEYSREAFDSLVQSADEYAPIAKKKPIGVPMEELAPTYDVEGKKGVPDGQQSFIEDAGVPKKVTRSELHRGIVDHIKSAFSARGFDFDEILRQAKNLSTFATVDNTPQRVMTKALGYKEGGILADLTVNKVAQNETEGIRWLNSYTDRKTGLLAQISKQYHINPGSKESAAAQMYAEGFYVNENNEIIQYGDAELAKDFPDATVQKNIKGLARDSRIRKIYDDTLAMINESRTRNAYPEIPRLDNYFLHFRAMDDTFSKLGLPFNPNDIRAKDLPTDLNGVTADLKPGQPYFASAMHRTGKRTSFDLLGGLERYLTSAKNQIYHIDDIQTLRALRNYIADTYGQANGLEGLDALSEEEAQERIKQVYGAHLSTFAKFLNEEANVLAGKTSLIDRGLEGVIGRRGITFLDTVNKQVGSNMVGLNVSSSLTNILPVVQTFAKTNKYDFVKAFSQLTSNKITSIFGKNDGFADSSPVIIRRKGAERFYRTAWQKAGDAGYVFMSAVDNISTELIARTKYNELTRKGMDSQQAHIETDKWVSRLMGDRSLGQQPQLYNSKMLGLFTKFQLEVRNQLDSQFYDTIQDAKVSNEDIENGLVRNAKTAAKVTSKFFQLAVAQHLFGKAFESVAGYNPAFDILSVLATAFGFDDEEESEDTALDNIEQAFLELLGDLPYTSTFTGGRIPISSALPVEQFVTGKDSYGNEKSRLETLGEIAPYYLLPGGYGQIKKTYQGLSMFSDDHPIAGSYTDSGNLRFPVEDTLGNRIQAGLFGQWASENARYYFDNDLAPLNEKQTQEFIDSGMPIQDYWEYRKGLSGLSTLAEKADYINSLDLTAEQKNILINNIADRKEDIDMSDYGEYGSFEEFDYANKNPEKYNFLKDNGVAYSEYKSFDDDTKDAYDWAYENPDKYTLSKAITDDLVAYRKYAGDLYDIRADKDENGKTISGSAKEKKIAYINNLDLEYGQKIILFKSLYEADDTYNYEIIDYLNGRADISYEEEVAILKELGFTVSSDGTVTWD